MSIQFRTKRKLSGVLRQTGRYSRRDDELEGNPDLDTPKKHVQSRELVAGWLTSYDRVVIVRQDDPCEIVDFFAWQPIRPWYRCDLYEQVVQGEVGQTLVSSLGHVSLWQRTSRKKKPGID